jgi:hypothetical protein
MQKGILIEESLVEMIDGKRLQEMTPILGKLFAPSSLRPRRMRFLALISATVSPNPISRYEEEQNQRTSPSKTESPTQWASKTSNLLFSIYE